jgi:hypothetical protein
MNKEINLKLEYSIFSIYYDIFDTPLNIDIKKLFEDNILPNIHNKPAFLIRFLEQEDILPKLYGNIANENEICRGQITYPRIIWNYGTEPILDATRIGNAWFYINTNNKLTIDVIIFITSRYINIIDEIKNNRNIYLITNSETAENYNTKDVNVINYDKYIISEIEYNKKKKEYAKHCWKDGYGNTVINPDILCKLNMIAEALNNKNLDYTCLRYCHKIENIEWKESIETIEQYILYFDYKKEA